MRGGGGRQADIERVTVCWLSPSAEPGPSSRFLLPSGLSPAGSAQILWALGYSGPVRPCPPWVPQHLSSDFGSPKTLYANSWLCPMHCGESLCLFSAAPFASKHMVKRTDLRVRQTGVQIQPQHLLLCDFKQSPHLSVLLFPPLHNGGIYTSLEGSL